MTTLPLPKLHRTGRGTPLVLMHCLGVDRHMWRDTVTALQDRHEVITYDFPGHGESSVPRSDYTIADLSAQLSAALSAAGIGRTHVAGVSLGGLVAQHFAAHNASRVDRLVLIDTVATYSPEWRQRLLDRGAEAGATKGTRVLAEGVIGSWFTAAAIAANGPALRYIRQVFGTTPGEGYAKACKALVAADYESLASRILAPTLALCGDQDAPIFLSAAQWFVDHLGDAKLVWLKPGKHAALLEQPEQFVAAVRSHLS